MTQLLPPYTVGAATVSAGGTVVTVTGILDDSNCREGDHFRDPASGLSTPIIARLTSTTFQIPAWRGSALAAAGYEIWPDSPLRLANGALAATTQMLINRLDTRGLIWLLPDGVASPVGISADEGQLIFSPSLGTLWKMQSGSWTVTVFPYGLVPAGSAAAPSIACATDPDTGMFWLGANQLGWSVGGVLQTYLASGLLSQIGAVHIYPSGVAPDNNVPGLLRFTKAATGGQYIALTAYATITYSIGLKYGLPTTFAIGPGHITDSNFIDPYLTLDANGLQVPLSTPSTSTTTGAIITPGGAGIGGDLWVAGQANVARLNISELSGEAHIELGQGRAGNGIAYIDFHAQNSGDYDFRIIRQSGANGTVQLVQSGTGGFSLLMNGGATAMAADQTGAVTFGSSINPTGGYVGRAGTGGATANVFNIYWTGAAAQLWIDTAHLGDLTYTSDPRFKRVTSRDPIALLDQIASIQFFHYRYRDLGLMRDDGIERYGVAADQLDTLFPGLHMVSGRAGAMNNNGEPVPQTLNIPAITVASLRMHQETQARLTDHDARIAALEARLAA